MVYRRWVNSGIASVLCKLTFLLSPLNLFYHWLVCEALSVSRDSVHYAVVK